MTNILTTLSNEALEWLLKQKNALKRDVSNVEERKQLNRLANAMKLESPLYTVINKHTALPQIAVLRNKGEAEAHLAVLCFTEREISEHEAESFGVENAFYTEIPKFLLNNGEPVDVRSAFFRRCYLMGIEYVLLNPMNGKAELRIPVDMLASVLADSEAEQMQIEVNRCANGAVTLLKQEACAKNMNFYDSFKPEAMKKMQNALFYTPVDDSHPLIFKEQMGEREVPAIYLFTNTDEAKGVMGLDCGLARVLLDDVMPLAVQNHMLCIVNPFSVKFALNIRL